MKTGKKKRRIRRSPKETIILNRMDSRVAFYKDYLNIPSGIISITDPKLQLDNNYKIPKGKYNILIHERKKCIMSILLLHVHKKYKGIEFPYKFNVACTGYVLLESGSVYVSDSKYKTKLKLKLNKSLKMDTNKAFYLPVGNGPGFYNVCSLSYSKHGVVGILLDFYEKGKKNPLFKNKKLTKK